jgi:hypothetical protein
MDISNLQNIIESFKDDDDMLNIITNIINELVNLDPEWDMTIDKIVKKNISKKFIKKIKSFFYKLNNINYLLTINLLLESYDVIEDLDSILQEKAFYVILKELSDILNNNNVSFHQNYTNSLQFLKKFKKIIH